MRALSLPPEIAAQLDAGAQLVVSVSGGKDSQAMLAAIMPLARLRGWTVCGVHADLGRAEWPQTAGFVQQLADAYGIVVHVVQRERGDLFDRFEEREAAVAGTGKPFWPSSAARYCTSDLKRGPINKLLRTFQGVVISAEGIRREESTGRAHTPCWEDRAAITTRTRTAITWNPLVDWTLQDVWEAIGTDTDDVTRRRALYAAGHESAALDGWAGHVAYVFGNERLSCVFCVLGSKNDLAVGARHNPDTLAYLVQLERRSGFTFKHKFSLESLQ